jgi:hypothetical protein
MEVFFISFSFLVLPGYCAVFLYQEVTDSGSYFSELNGKKIFRNNTTKTGDNKTARMFLFKSILCYWVQNHIKTATFFV